MAVYTKRNAILIWSLHHFKTVLQQFYKQCIKYFTIILYKLNQFQYFALLILNPVLGIGSQNAAPGKLCTWKYR